MAIHTKSNVPGAASPCPAQAAVTLTMVLCAVVLLLMMAFGLVMRLAQANIITVEPTLFYRLMTAHGIGMVGTAAITGATIMWYFLARHVSLTAWVFWALIGFFLAGVVAILGAIFIGGFAGAWTFLFPLPQHSGGLWEPSAAAAYLVGVVLVGVGFLLFLLEAGRAIISRYGNLGNALGWPLLLTGVQNDLPPPTVVASAAVVVFNGIGTIVGAAVLLISLVNLLVPSFTVDALLAKNMIYFFGHVFINASIYMAVIAVYEIVPSYTGRPWKTSRVFVASWSAVMLMVMAVYPHHLQQDTVMPAWALIMGQVISYASGLPLLAVTVFSLLAYLYRSGIRWDLTSALLVLGVFGWAMGSVPAIIDGMVSVNKVMHNTQWVPGHFHTYLLVGEIAIVLGFMSWLGSAAEARLKPLPVNGAFWAYTIGGFGFVLVFLTSGAMSIPRRWAVHLPNWWGQDRLGSLFAAITIAGAGLLIWALAKRLIATNKV